MEKTQALRYRIAPLEMTPSEGRPGPLACGQPVCKEKGDICPNMNNLGWNSSGRKRPK